MIKQGEISCLLVADGLPPQVLPVSIPDETGQSKKTNATLAYEIVLAFEICHFTGQSNMPAEFGNVFPSTQPLSIQSAAICPTRMR